MPSGPGPDQPRLLCDGSVAAQVRPTGVAVVAGAAKVAGGRADAWVDIDEREHRRRALLGLGAVTSLELLDRVLGLPRGGWVRWNDLTPEETRSLRAAPTGVVVGSALGVCRTLAPPAAVPLVLIRSASWRRGLRTASAFEPFAQRVLILDGSCRSLREVTWEADCLGVGVWIENGAGTEEVVRPAPWRQRYVTAAGWRFRERAYGVWLSAARLGG